MYMCVSHGSEHDTMINPQGALLTNIFLTLSPPDPTMTVDNVTQILNKMQGDRWAGVMVGLFGLDISESLVEEIQRRYSTDTEKNHACAYQCLCVYDIVK